MKELIEIYRMVEASTETRIKLIKEMGCLINHQYASNITEPLQIELIRLLDENYDFSKDEHLSCYFKDKDIEETFKRPNQKESEDKIIVKIELDNYIHLHVKGDIKISYPIFGSKDEIEKKIDKFCEDLKKAVNNERISDLR